MENFIEQVEHETIPALEIVYSSMGDLDDANGQRFILQGIIARLKGQCEAVQTKTSI